MRSLQRSIIELHLVERDGGRKGTIGMLDEANGRLKPEKTEQREARERPLSAAKCPNPDRLPSLASHLIPIPFCLPDSSFSALGTQHSARSPISRFPT